VFDLRELGFKVGPGGFFVGYKTFVSSSDPTWWFCKA
jgi:hypothetical protein